MMFEISHPETSLQFSPRVASYGRDRSSALALCAGVSLYGALLLTMLSLYAVSGFWSADGSALESASVSLAAELRTAALLSGLLSLGFGGVLLTLRRGWAKLGFAARVGASVLASVGTLFVLGLNSQGPIAYAVEIDASWAWPLGLVVLSLGMSMGLFATKLGRVIEDVLVERQEKARWANPLRFSESLGWAAKPPARNACSSVGRDRMGNARSLPGVQVGRKAGAGERRVPLVNRRVRRTADVGSLGSRRSRTAAAASPFRRAAQTPSRSNRVSMETQPAPTKRDLLSPSQPYPKLRRMARILSSDLQALLRLGSPLVDREGTQAELPISLPDLSEEQGSRREKSPRRISKTKRVPSRRRPTEDPNLQGTLFRAR